MDGYRPDTYGTSFADVYDEWFGDVSDAAATVARVTALVPGARVLELGVGTGRLALPLAAAGCEVWGIDASPAMLGRLRAKPSGDAIHLVVGDLADIDDLLPRDLTVDVVLCAFNTLFNLPDESAQAACLVGAARRLRPGGWLLLEAVAPPTDAPVDDIGIRSIELDRVVLTVARHDADTQRITGHHVELTESGGVRLRPWLVRYLTVDQCDRLAGRAGLTLATRWADWTGAPFDPAAGRHVSCYRPGTGVPDGSAHRSPHGAPGESPPVA